jgi:hypothetical protein
VKLKLNVTLLLSMIYLVFISINLVTIVLLNQVFYDNQPVYVVLSHKLDVFKIHLELLRTCQKLTSNSGKLPSLTFKSAYYSKLTFFLIPYCF